MKLYWALARRSFFLWFGAIWMTAGLGVLAAAIEDTRIQLAFRWSARVAQARVSGKQWLPAGQDRSTTSYRISYRFETDAGEPVESSAEAGVAAWEAAREGDRLPVEYLVDSPRVNRLAGHSRLAATLIPLLLGGLVGGAGMGLVAVNLRRIGRQHRIFTAGTPVDARITGIRASHFKRGSTHLCHIHYAFTTPTGQTFQGKSPPMHPRETDAYAAGDRVEVRYDPADPRQSVWTRL